MELKATWWLSTMNIKSHVCVHWWFTYLLKVTILNFGYKRKWERFKKESGRNGKDKEDTKYGWR